MDDIKPTIISDEEILCSQEECPQWYDERYCRITDDRTPYICTPWFMNEVKQLRAQLDRAQSIAVLMAMDCIPVCPYYNARVDKECPTPRHIPEDCVKCINEYIKEGK